MIQRTSPHPPQSWPKTSSPRPSSHQDRSTKPDVEVEGSRNVTLAPPPIGMINEDKSAGQRA